ncbi:MAG: hypothetical protein GKR89_21035 [Candidatus Latescibacteria bacterium]|nr:hypothetical protein [Candidatus Latescibacterota bacterium]
MDHKAPSPTPPEGEKTYYLDDPDNVKKIIRVFIGLCVVVVGIDLFVHRHLSFAERIFAAEGWFGFYAFYGFVSCVVLVVVAKELRKVLMRREDYYD